MFNKFIINKDNLINNIKQVKVKNPNTKICAMVKANAYGVGDINVVQILDEYVDFFGVACFFEAKKLKSYTSKKILIVGTLEKGEIDNTFSYTCGSIDDVLFLRNLKTKINIHLKINTGMNRYGFGNLKIFKMALKLIQSSHLVLEGIFTHYATTDVYVDKQTERFEKYLKIVQKFGFKPIVHADNSFVNEHFEHNYDMVRIGYSLYNCTNNRFKSVVEIVSKVVQIHKVNKGEIVGYDYRCVANKKLKVAVVPVGYADGFDMRYIGLQLIIKGKSCKVLNICMDCFMLDVSDVEIKKGEEIHLLNNFNNLSLYAKHAQTSEYEVMTKFSQLRAERITN